MKRFEFLKTGFFGTGFVLFGLNPFYKMNLENQMNSISKKKSSFKTIGFNHLPNPKTTYMENSVLHLSNTRGDANHGWLHSKHSFSFANYYNPERMNFGALRVLNDDIVDGGMGFGSHPHENMEIISIPLQGDLEHKDSMGNTTVIKNGDIQIMSAGTGVTHSEYNKNSTEKVSFLQIWIIPNKKNITPRYDQITLDPKARENTFQQIVSPIADDEGVWIQQDAWLHIGKFDASKKETYTVKKEGNGVYIFVLKGKVKINDQELNTRDALGLWDTSTINMEMLEKSDLLLIEVPMNF